MSGRNKSIDVAVACQGGGSHTAFTAGVLKTILKEKDKKYKIMGLSGTSGGAICALLAWYGLLINDINPKKRQYEQKSIREIEDRRNELSGNRSLYQEVDFIENVNKWVEAEYLPDSQYKHIKVRWIDMLGEDLDI